jgi:hypothetical protein
MEDDMATLFKSRKRRRNVWDIQRQRNQQGEWERTDQELRRTEHRYIDGCGLMLILLFAACACLALFALMALRSLRAFLGER